MVDCDYANGFHVSNEAFSRLIHSLLNANMFHLSLEVTLMLADQEEALGDWV